jgi:hypothetical protein
MQPHHGPRHWKLPTCGWAQPLEEDSLASKLDQTMLLVDRCRELDEAVQRPQPPIGDFVAAADENGMALLRPLNHLEMARNVSS